MSQPNPDELPGGMVTLGLVIEMPDQSAKHIATHLVRRFSRSNFSRSTSDSAIKRLLKQDRIRCTYRSSDTERASDCYEATPEGERVFREWMYDLPRDRGGSDLPLREAMYGRIELCKAEDIPRLLDLAREEVLVSTDLFEEATKRLRHHDRKERRLKQHRPREKTPIQRVREILMHIEPLHWSHRSERYELIVEALEDIMNDMSNGGAEVGGV